MSNTLPVLFFSFWSLGVTGAVAAPSLDRTSLAAVATPQGTEEGQGERHELIFRIVNFVLLAGGLGLLLRKPVREFFTQRSTAIHKSLQEGRKALEASQAQLNVVEEKLRRVDEEVRAFKASVTQEISAERERVRKETAEEVQKILNAAQAQMETATRVAQLELRTQAVAQATKLAEQMIRRRLDDAGRKRLVQRFVEGLKN